jgi:hypothetical protein
MLESILLSPAHAALLQTLASEADLDLDATLQLVFSEWSLEHSAEDAVDELPELDDDEEGVEFSLDGMLDLLEEWLEDEELTNEELSWAFGSAIEYYADQN